MTLYPSWVPPEDTRPIDERLREGFECMQRQWEREKEAPMRVRQMTVGPRLYKLIKDAQALDWTPEEKLAARESQETWERENEYR